jgi:hypothetical protein
MTEYINPQWRLPNAKEGSNQGYSMNFSGQQINSSSNLGISGASSRTFSAWIKTTDAGGGWDVIVATGGSGNTGNNFELDFRNNVIMWERWGLGIMGSVVVNDGNWHHACITYDGNILKLYVDGSEDTAGDFPYTIGATTSTDTPVIMGGMNHSSKYFNGQIYGVAIFDYALPAIGSNSVATLYNSGTPFNPMALASPPKAYYQLGNAAHMGSNYLTPNSAITGGYAMSSTQATSRFFTKIKPAGKSNITFSTWYRAAGSSSGAQIFYSGSYGTYYLKTNGAGVLWHGVMVASGSTGSSAYAIFPFDYDDGNWHHYIFNFDGSHFKTYIDGVLIKKTAKTGVLTSWGSTDAVLGSNHNTNSNGSATGDYSNFVAYDSTLTDGGVAEGDVAGGEIAELYNGGSPVLSFDDFPQKSNIETWFRLDQTEIYSGSTWRLNDASSAYSSSLDFENSSNQYISGSASLPNSDYTISAWINLETVTTESIVTWGEDTAGKRRSLFIWNGGSGDYKLYSSTAYSNVGGSTALATGQWYHAAVTVSSAGVANIYLNGSPDGTGTNTLNSFTNTNFYIGRTPIGEYFDGKISNAQIFNTVLPATGSNSIETLYNNGKPLADMSSFSSLVSWWKLDNTTTGIEDSKGSNDGTNNGTTKVIGSVSTKNATTWQITPSNLINQTGLLMFKSYSPYALAFDGDDYIDCGNNSIFDITSALTLSAWVKLSSATTNQFYISKRGSSDAYQISSFSNKAVGMSIWIGGSRKDLIGTTNHVQDVWYHVVGTYDGSYMRVYVDGAEENSVAQTGAIDTTTAKLILGSWDSVGFSLDGDLSNCAIWNTALTSLQVREVYNEGRPSNLHNFSGTAPVAWWQLGSNSSWTSPAWTVLDEIGSNDGTSDSMMENAIVNGVGTSGNGVSVNMSFPTNISGSSPNGEGNSLSVNMTLANIAGGVN